MAVAGSVQLLPARSGLGPGICARVPTLPVFRPRLPQPTSLARKSDAGRRHHLSPVSQCVRELQRSDASPATGRCPDAARSRPLRREVVARTRALLYADRTSGVPPPPLLRASPVLRQSDLPPPCSTRCPRRPFARRQSDDRATDEARGDFWSQDHQTTSRQARNRDRESRLAKPPSSAAIAATDRSSSTSAITARCGL